MPVFLHLRLRVSSKNLPRLKDFLQKAIPIYEQPGGIKVRLLQDYGDPTRLIELIEYTTLRDYEADQRRVEEDPVQLSLIEEWRQLLSEPPVVEVWKEL